MVMCERCEGTGEVAKVAKGCAICGGVGSMTDMHGEVTCPECEDGVIYSSCVVCDGTGETDDLPSV